MVYLELREGRKMKKTWLIPAALLFLSGCDREITLPTATDLDRAPVERLVGKVYYHDLAAGDQYDIFMADLYIVPKATATTGYEIFVQFPGIEGRRVAGARGITKPENAEIDGAVKEGLVVNATFPLGEVDLSQYGFVLRKIEALTSPIADDYAPSLSNRNWIAWMMDPDGRNNNPDNSEIGYMNLADRAVHQLTPINGKYGGLNADAEWRDDETIAWVHDGKIVEVNLKNLNSVAPVLPEWGWPQFDPVYSPDGTMLLFNTWVRGKKNSFLKYLQTGTFVSVLPPEYFTPYTDDNPTWIFSNTRITGHIFMPKKGRIYTRDFQSARFAIITDSLRDFRYVTPVKIKSKIYLVFSERPATGQPRLWICSESGADLRELGRTGDEAVFVMLGLPVPSGQDDLERAAAVYASRFGD
jgi:hypothetical protein